MLTVDNHGFHWFQLVSWLTTVESKAFSPSTSRSPSPSLPTLKPAAAEGRRESAPPVPGADHHGELYDSWLGRFCGYLFGSTILVRAKGQVKPPGFGLQIYGRIRPQPPGGLIPFSQWPWEETSSANIKSRWQCESPTLFLAQIHSKRP